MNRYYCKLNIHFNKYSNMYELWRIIIDREDKLYPIHWKWLEFHANTKATLKYLAKKNFPEIYKDIKFD